MFNYLLPGHNLAKHGRDSFLGPVQSWPPNAGRGLVQFLMRTSVPFPHDLLHAPQAPHSVKFPSTKNKKKQFTLYSK